MRSHPSCWNKTLAKLGFRRKSRKYTTRHSSNQQPRSFELLETRQLLAATTVDLFAAGDTGEETMELQVDGATVATFNNVGGDAANRVFQNFSYTHPTEVTADQISIVYPNDGPAANGADRNLRVDKIVVNGETFETEAPTTYSTAGQPHALSVL